MKGIQRIGQTADHMGMGQVATLARRRRQYEEVRNTSNGRRPSLNIYSLSSFSSGTGTWSPMQRGIELAPLPPFPPIACSLPS